MTLRSFCSLWFIPCLALSAVAGGFGNDNGGDTLRPETGSAWFLGDDPISYCLEVNSRFGVTEREVRETFERVVTNWRRYLEQKRVVGLATQLTFHSACDGTEELALYLGVENEAVRTAKEIFDNPSGFAHRTRYDLTRGRGRGFIWIAPMSRERDWSRPGRLAGILSHEFGHVLGNAHVSGTIMDFEIERILFKYPASSGEFYFNIDLSHELLTCFTCDQVYRAAHVNESAYALNPQELARFFKLYTGRAATSDIALTLRSYALDGTPRYELTMKDDAGAETLKIDTQADFDMTHFGEFNIFRTTHQDAAGRVHMTAYHAYALNLYGTLRTKTGVKIPVVIGHNSSDTGNAGGFLNLRALDPRDGRMRILFASEVPYAAR